MDVLREDEIESGADTVPEAVSEVLNDTERKGTVLELECSDLALEDVAFLPVLESGRQNGLPEISARVLESDERD